MKKISDQELLSLIGKKFGRWQVVSFVGYKFANNDTKHKSYYFECICKCGKMSHVRRHSLLAGSSIQCIPCSRKEENFSERLEDLKKVIAPPRKR